MASIGTDIRMATAPRFTDTQMNCQTGGELHPARSVYICQDAPFRSRSLASNKAVAAARQINLFCASVRIPLVES